MIETWLNEHTFVTFDGRVIELFEVAGGVKSTRAHIATLASVTLETDRKGRAILTVITAKGLPLYKTFARGPYVPAAEHLVAAVAAARGC